MEKPKTIVYKIEAITIEEPYEIDLEAISIPELKKMLPEKILYRRVI